MTVNAFPMHGVLKLRGEGFRTRDGHLIEWMGRLTPGATGVEIYSRPEPFPRTEIAALRSRGSSGLPSGLRDRSRSVLALPGLRRRDWWERSVRHYPWSTVDPTLPSVVWNPLLGNADAAAMARLSGSCLVVDLLDDWTVHQAFAGIRAGVTAGYRTLFEKAHLVYANSEATLALAQRHGRSDAQLMLNGVDPTLFTLRQLVQPVPTVGYVGKIGFRIDLDIVRRTTEALPDLRFVFAGPVLEAEYGRALRKLPNVLLIGDIHYDRLPSLLETFDAGWVPHKVGDGEVGGDVLKVYEYRAAGLPVVTTSVIGAQSRALPGVRVSGTPADVLAELFSAGARPTREPFEVPASMTWEHKAGTILQAIADRSGS